MFGHQTYAGFITEQSIGGASFVRVDVPAVSDQAPFTKLFGPTAIYSISPCSEELAHLVAKKTHSAPLSIYLPELYPPKEPKALSAGDPFDRSDDEDDQDEDRV